MEIRVIIVVKWWHDTCSLPKHVKIKQIKREHISYINLFNASKNLYSS